MPALAIGTGPSYYSQGQTLTLVGMVDNPSLQTLPVILGNFRDGLRNDLAMGITAGVNLSFSMPSSTAGSLMVQAYDHGNPLSLWNSSDQLVSQVIAPIAIGNNIVTFAIPAHLVAKGDAIDLKWTFSSPSSLPSVVLSTDVFVVERAWWDVIGGVRGTSAWPIPQITWTKNGQNLTYAWPYYAPSVLLGYQGYSIAWDQPTSAPQTNSTIGGSLSLQGLSPGQHHADITFFFAGGHTVTVSSPVITV